MPIFEYRCRKCDEQFEHLAIPTTTEVAACPKCKSKGRNLETLISNFATKTEGALERQRALVKKESNNLRYEQHQMEKRIASED